MASIATGTWIDRDAAHDRGSPGRSGSPPGDWNRIGTAHAGRHLAGIGPGEIRSSSSREARLHHQKPGRCSIAYVDDIARRRARRPAGVRTYVSDGRRPPQDVGGCRT
jgi:hypothetical protein